MSAEIPVPGQGAKEQRGVLLTPRQMLEELFQEGSGRATKVKAVFAHAWYHKLHAIKDTMDLRKSVLEQKGQYVPEDIIAGLNHAAAAVEAFGKKVNRWWSPEAGPQKETYFEGRGIARRIFEQYLDIVEAGEDRVIAERGLALGIKYGYDWHVRPSLERLVAA